MINPPLRSEITYPKPETLQPSDNQTYNEILRRRKAEDNAKFNGLQLGDVDKKLKSLQRYLAFVKEGEKCVAHKNRGKIRLDINLGNY